MIRSSKKPPTETDWRLFPFIRYGYILLGILLTTNGLAQLQASFTLSKDGGCKPLNVQFTNTTSGAGAGVIYSWDLGNGNSSALVNPGATYVDEKQYTITLTAKQGNETSTFSKQITVYKTPSVDFAATPTKGCMPLDVSFSSTVTPGDGTVTRYLWDFGDGQTADGALVTAPKHTYTFAQQAPVSLTVTNSFGCFNTTTYSGMVDVYPEVVVDFNADKLMVCKAGEAVKFTNKSIGGTLEKFEWDFGDGVTSNEKNPVHTYNVEGVFDVKLKVTNTKGCSNEKVNPKYIRVGSFGHKINFDRNAIKCTGQNSTTFYASYAGGDYNYGVRWFLDGLPVSSFQEHRYDLHHTDTGKYTIRAVFNFSGCVVDTSEVVTVYPSPPLKGMVIKRSPSCSPPFEMSFSDTTPGVTKWSWTFWDINVPNEKRVLKEFTHSFPNETEITPTVFLKVENKFGCIAQDVKYFALKSTKINVSLLSAGNEGNNCKSRISKFGASLWSFFPDSFLVESLEWDFGDTIVKGVTSLEHKFKNSGVQNIFFRYKTAMGCSGTVKYVHVVYKVADSLDFTILPSNEICGNNFFRIIPKGVPGAYYSFYYGNWKPIGVVGESSYPFQLRDSGLFDVHMVFTQSSQGYCRDTLTKKSYLHIKAPFSGIGKVVQTCDGDRGLVKIADTSRFASFWEWDFGDGTKKTYTTKPDTAEHHYTKSGNYKVYQRVRFESCEVLDSVIVKVFLKQKPVITLARDSICLHEYSAPLRITIADSSSYMGNLASDFYYSYKAFYYPGGYSRDGFGFANGYRNGYWGDLYPDSAGFTSVRIVIGSYNCFDSSDILPFKIKGPSAHFGVADKWKCFNDTIQFLDASSGNLNVPIVKWDWDFDNGYTISKNTGGNFGYKYDRPGNFFPNLKVTDADGCHAETRGHLYDGGELWLEGPKAVIGASSTSIAINSTVQFSNSSFGRYPYEDGKYTWYMPDGSEFSGFEPSGFLFKDEGEFEVKLVARNPYFGCIDSTSLTISVRKVNAKFTHSISYINNNGCPPAIVRFTSTATNATRYGWNFGDGGTGGNQSNVTHTYNQPGIFQVWHYSYDENDNVDSSFDFIEIKGPYALISADRLSGCNNLLVTLNAEVKNANSYIWDLGDGTISSSADKKITHQYLSAGLYTPSLILKDQEGCEATSVLPDKIIVDSLHADFSFAPLRICAGSSVGFTGLPESFSSSRLGATLTYNWSVANTPLNVDKDFTHKFINEGNFNVAFEVASMFGCKVTVLKELKIEPPINAVIKGPLAVCKGDTASFTASAMSIGMSWRWIVPGQGSITNSYTPAIQWNIPGTYTISLLADNGACTDSVVHQVTVNNLPTITTGPANASICLGDTLNLTVQGSGVHLWDANTMLLQAGNFIAKVWPVQDTWFKVQSLSAEGCRSSDSIRVSVIQPFNMQVITDAEACLGKTVNLTASGAATYKWQPTTGLSNSTVANPIATATTSTVYKVTGYDGFGCFSDTAEVLVTIHPLPIVNAGADISVAGGQTANLSATSTLSGVTWSWLPPTYLSCADCPNPESRPLRDISYMVTASSAHGCTSSDTINIKVLCSSESIFIPNAFTPNGDGLNERFGVLGGGFSNIKFFRVTDRWGKIVFERRNVLPTDISSFWNGNYPDGSAAVSGSYIYSIQVECATGLLFDYKGTVSLMR